MADFGGTHDERLAKLRASSFGMETIRAAISNTYYEARNFGLTMEDAADVAAEAVERLLGTKHIVEFADDGFGLQHPFRCRPNLLVCEYSRYLADQDIPEEDPGLYEMELVERGGIHADAVYTRLP